MSPARARRASEVPPPTRTASGSASSSSTADTVVGETKASSDIAHVGTHRLDDRYVAGASTEVSRHVLPNRLLTRAWMLPFQGVGRCHLARRRDAALHPLVFDERLDHRGIALRDAFDREHVRAVTERREVDARAHGEAVDHDGAGPTDADRTALLRPRQTSGADDVEQQRIGLDLELALGVV